MMRPFLSGLALLAMAGAALGAPDFTGSYKIDKARSSFGQFPAPEKFERKVEHAEPNLRMTTVQSGFQGGEITTELKYTTDGKESVNVIRGSESRGTARWDGDVLVIESTRSTPNGDFKMTERWSSVDGGKALQIDAKMTGAFGEAALKFHLVKQ